jgi:hypothetical protein
MSTPNITPVVEAIANPANTRSRLMRTSSPHVPEYHARAWRGPKIQSHHALATSNGDGNDALETAPLAVTTSQITRIAMGRAIRRANRHHFLAADFTFGSIFWTFDDSEVASLWDCNKGVAMLVSGGPDSGRPLACQ